MDELAGELESIFIIMEGTDEGAGQYRRRVATTNSVQIHVGVRKPSNARLIQFAFPVAAVPSGFQLPQFRTLEIEHSTGSEHGSTVDITLCASERSYNDVFTSLAADIAARLRSDMSVTDAFRTLLLRLSQWQRLLQRDVKDGLGTGEQLGLYGELLMLDVHLLDMLSPPVAISAWTGPSGSPKDFEFAGNIALEVKASRARPPYQLSISSERQLDTSGLASLFLAHFLFDLMRGGADTLPALVAKLRNSFLTTGCIQQFEDALLDAGYFSTHEKHYYSTGYIHRGVTFYHVREGFPRITESIIPSGTGDVRYTISASACDEYRVSADSMRSSIGGSV